jgi:hypothetical protein
MIDVVPLASSRVGLNAADGRMVLLIFIGLALMG